MKSKRKKHEIQTFKLRVFFLSEIGIKYITNMICDMFCLFCVHAPIAVFSNDVHKSLLSNIERKYSLIFFVNGKKSYTV